MSRSFGRNVINDERFACEGDIRGVGISLDAAEAGDFGTLIVGGAAAFIDIGEVDVAVGGEVGIEGEAQEAMIEGLVDVSADIQERRCQEVTVLDDPDLASVLAD